MSTEPKAIYDLVLEGADYPEWDGPPERTLLLCSHPRSGSTLLGEILYFTGQFGCPLEYFHKGFRPAFQARWQAPDLTALLTHSRRMRTNPAGLFSCKLFWRDVEDLMLELAPSLARSFVETHAEEVAASAYRELHELLQTQFPQPTYIHLARQDRVRLAISSATAAQTGKWRAIPGQVSKARGSTPSPAYDYEQIASLLAYGDYCQAHWNRYFTENQLAPHNLSYEQLVRPDRQPLRTLLANLGFTGDLPPVRMQRQADARSEQWLVRFLMDHAARNAL